MNFERVRFYKHIIVTVVILIVSLSISTIYFAVLNNNLKDRVLELELENEAVLVQSNTYGQKSAPSFDYQELYPEMYAESPAELIVMPDTVYLTFDDGPSARTSEILDILKEKNIKATFFINGIDAEKQKELIKRIVSEGHSIGVHTYSHVYDHIYSSVEGFLTDFNKTYNIIYNVTGVKPGIFRFPGGSVNQYSSLVYKEIIAEMTRRGFTYYDWNASGGDAALNVTAKSVYNNSINTSENKNTVILLMHDSVGKHHTVAALPGVIQHFEEKGFQFDQITNDVSPITFDYIYHK